MAAFHDVVDCVQHNKVAIREPLEEIFHELDLPIGFFVSLDLDVIVVHVDVAYLLHQLKLLSNLIKSDLWTLHKL